MEELNVLFESDTEQLIEVMPPYQRKLVTQLLEQGKDYIITADILLSVKPSNTVGFGGEPSKPNLYRERLMDELEKFICGDKKYKQEREQITASTNKSREYIVGVISGALGTTLGTAGTVILPIVVLLIINLGKISVNAWCQHRQVERDGNIA